jgi:uncharacterized protein YegJ (DUF2314 family)
MHRNSCLTKRILRNRAIVGIAIVLILAAAIFRRNDIRLWFGPGLEPEVYSVDETDVEMNAAMENARRTVGTFIAALNHPGTSRTNFSIKLGIREKDEVEHFWLKNVKHDGGRFTGTIGNTPESVHTVKLGQPMSVPAKQISDWMFIENGVLRGNFTMRVMRSRLSPEERAKMDSQFGFRIE